MVYKYIDENGGSSVDLPIEFEFNLSDEASLEEVIAGLNGARFGSVITAPGKVNVSSPDSATAVFVKKDWLDDNFAAQRAYGRSFNDQNDVISGTFTRKLVIEGDTAHFEYGGTFGNGDSSVSVTGSKLSDKSFAISSNGDGTYSRNQSGNIFTDEVKFTGSNGSIVTLSFSVNLDEYLSGIDSNDDTTMKKEFSADFTAAGSAQRYFTLSANEKNNVSFEAIYTDITLNAPERELWIQSGTEKDHGIMMKWEGLNNSIIGISGTNVLTRGGAETAIDQVKRAIDKISEQVGTTMLAQANQTPQGVLSLIG